MPPSNHWRIISISAHDGATNMAIDESILEEHLSGNVPATLRLYLFSPPAVTIGYGQKVPTQFAERVREKGWDMVRRPTGGRAVLHYKELTYSFVASLNGSVLTTYKQICRGLILAMEELGVELELGGNNSQYKSHHDCFAATTCADLHYRGDKMIGSAQLRRKGAVLQHGSILLSQDQHVMSELLGSSGEEKGRARTPLKRHANLFDILKRDVAPGDLETVLQRGFERAFDVTIVPGELTEAEMSLAARLQEGYRISAVTEPPRTTETQIRI